MIDDALENIKQLLNFYNSGDIIGAEKSARVVLEILQARLDAEDHKLCYVETNLLPTERVKYIKLLRENYTIGLREAKDLSEARNFRPIILKAWLTHREIRLFKEKCGNSIKTKCSLSHEHNCCCEESIFKNS